MFAGYYISGYGICQHIHSDTVVDTRLLINICLKKSNPLLKSLQWHLLERLPDLYLFPCI